jgi:hypothetical protein
MQDREKLGETGDPLEGRLLEAIDRDAVGTIWGPGMPPERIAGFHSLDTFPWALVVFADGENNPSPHHQLQKWIHPRCTGVDSAHLRYHSP